MKIDRRDDPAWPLTRFQDEQIERQCAELGISRDELIRRAREQLKICRQQMQKKRGQDRDRETR